jgi:hypothetical protein
MVRKKSICDVALQLRRYGAPVSALHSSVFARLASGAFYKTIVPAIFCEIIFFDDSIKFVSGEPRIGSGAGSGVPVIFKHWKTLDSGFRQE